jgi:hypothetical protein
MDEWQGCYSSFAEVYGTKDARWYGADIINTLLSEGTRQEIAFHGYSHRIFDPNAMNQQEARAEIEQWLHVSSRKAVTPRAVVFPRNIVGHLEAFRDLGFICFRADPQRAFLIRNKVFGRYSKAIDQILSVSALPLFPISAPLDHGMVCLFSSQCFFDLNRRVELLLDGMNLHTLRLRRIRAGIRRAAREGRVIHLWAHPCDFRTEKDFLKLRYVLDAAAQEISAGRMRSVGMTEMAQIAMVRQNLGSSALDYGL